MPAITRKDGQKFAIYTYRELLGLKKSSLLKREIELLQQEHGQYARFYWQDDGDIEAVFSQDSGYLLAESVWQYLKEPENLLYCEVLPNETSAILVVIRAGAVYLDAEISLENLIDEFETLVSVEHQYDIYIYGNVPLAEYAAENVFAFDTEQVKSFTILNKSVFLNLKLNNDFLLLPVSKAIADLKLKEFSSIPWVVGAIAIVVMGYFGYQMLKPAPPPPAAPTITNPYSQYQQSLMSPAPEEVLIAVSEQVHSLYTIPGWAPATLVYKDGQLTVTLTPQLQAPGDLLLHWTKYRNMDVGVQPGHAILNIPISVPARSRPMVIYNLKEILSKLFDQTRLLLPGATMSITVPAKQGIALSSDMTISFGGVTAPILGIYAQTWKNKPLVLKGMNFTIDSGLISGQIQLTVLGN